MFHALAERKIRQMFASLSEGDYEPALEGLAPDFEHVFAGAHALGGTRRTAAGLRAWFERLYRLFPDLDFEVGTVTVSGPAWDLTIAAEWIDRAAPAGGGTYENHGVHIVRLKRGRLASIHAYLDTKVLSDCLDTMAGRGIEEASAPPIADPAEALRPHGHRSVRAPRGRAGRGSAGAAGLSALGTSSSGAAYLGAAAIGAVAMGALAIGALAIGRLAVGRLLLAEGRIGRLEIDELIVHRTPDRTGRL